MNERTTTIPTEDWTRKPARAWRQQLHLSSTVLQHPPRVLADDSAVAGAWGTRELIEERTAFLLEGLMGRQEEPDDA